MCRGGGFYKKSDPEGVVERTFFRGQRVQLLEECGGGAVKFLFWGGELFRGGAETFKETMNNFN